MFVDVGETERNRQGGLGAVVELIPETASDGAPQLQVLQRVFSSMPKVSTNTFFAQENRSQHQLASEFLAMHLLARLPIIVFAFQQEALAVGVGVIRTALLNMPVLLLPDAVLPPTDIVPVSRSGSRLIAVMSSSGICRQGRFRHFLRVGRAEKKFPHHVLGFSRAAKSAWGCRSAGAGL
ncbi:MAG: hypothetical protein U0361_10845 [Nitrospiraceae bacterium]